MRNYRVIMRIAGSLFFYSLMSVSRYETVPCSFEIFFFSLSFTSLHFLRPTYKGPM
uniref:Uncharacterized protein n=1 Tax=Daphnia magna TaxID=35525 RepID=A0A0P5AMH1_9CRUS